MSYPTTAQRCRSETETFILEDLSSSVLSKLKKYHPSGNFFSGVSLETPWKHPSEI